MNTQAHIQVAKSCAGAHCTNHQWPAPHSALQNYQAAAGSDSTVGKASQQRFISLDLPSKPTRYLRGGVRHDAIGNVYAVIENASPVAVGRVQLHVVRYDANTRKAVQQSQPIMLNSGIAANKQGQVQVQGLQVKTEAELKLFRVVIDGAELAGGRSLR